MDSAQQQSESALELDARNLTAKIRSTSLNTIATVVTLIIVCVSGVFLYQHIAHSQARDETIAKAFNVMAQAQREQNCLIAIPEAQREGKAEFCKRITQ